MADTNAELYIGGQVFRLKFHDNTDGTYSLVVANVLGGGDATAANQTTEITKLTSIDGKVPAKGQATAANSTPVVLASDQAAIPTSDNGPAWTSAFGVTSAVVASADMTVAASITDVPTTSQKIVLTDIIVSSDTQMRLDLQEETSGTVVASLYLSAYAPVQLTPRGKLKLATINKRLQAKATVAGNLRITAFYFSEA